MIQPSEYRMQCDNCKKFLRNNKGEIVESPSVKTISTVASFHNWTQQDNKDICEDCVALAETVESIAIKKPEAVTPGFKPKY